MGHNLVSIVQLGNIKIVIKHNRLGAVEFGNELYHNVGVLSTRAEWLMIAKGSQHVTEEQLAWHLNRFIDQSSAIITKVVEKAFTGEDNSI